MDRRKPSSPAKAACSGVRGRQQRLSSVVWVGGTMPGGQGGVWKVMENALDIKNAIQRLYHNNVTIKALVVVSKDGKILEKSVSPEIAQRYAELIPPIVRMARACIRDLDPQNDLKFLRVRSKQHEIMVAPYQEFSLVVIQDVQVDE